MGYVLEWRFGWHCQFRRWCHQLSAGLADRECLGRCWWQQGVGYVLSLFLHTVYLLLWLLRLFYVVFDVVSVLLSCFIVFHLRLAFWHQRFIGVWHICILTIQLTCEQHVNWFDVDVLIALFPVLLLHVFWDGFMFPCVCFGCAICKHSSVWHVFGCAISKHPLFDTRFVVSRVASIESTKRKVVFQEKHISNDQHHFSRTLGSSMIGDTLLQENSEMFRVLRRHKCENVARTLGLDRFMVKLLKKHCFSNEKCEMFRALRR